MSIALFFATLPLRYPRLVAFAKRWWKLGLGIALAAGAYFAFTNWIAGERKEAFNSGFSTAEAQYKAAVDAANAQSAKDQQALNLIATNFGWLAKSREQDVRLVVQPQIERITREIAENPVYRQCTLTDGVFDATNAATAGVNARIAPSKP